MSIGKYEKAPPKGLPWIIIAAAAALIALLLLFLLKGCGSTPVTNSDSNPSTVEKNPDSIAIPGYEGLSLKANSKKQNLCMPNPAQNTCYFQISLFLEDGTLLWQSELIAPGAISKPMTLEKELEKGTYLKAVLHYSCFEMDENLTPLNGAEIKVTLRVK